MKIILLQDVAKIGKRFEVKDVSDGFALNFLIPQGKAKFADPKTVESLKLQKEKEDSTKKEQGDRIKGILKKIGEIKTSAKANKEGHLFAKIGSSEILSLLKERGDVEMKDSQIILDEPIKKIGEHKISVKVGEEIFELVLKVEAE